MMSPASAGRGQYLLQLESLIPAGQSDAELPAFECPVAKEDPGAAGDALAEQVVVAVMARVLLDHVGDDPAQRPGLARALRRLLAENTQARGLREHLPLRGALS